MRNLSESQLERINPFSRCSPRGWRVRRQWHHLRHQTRTSVEGYT